MLRRRQRAQRCRCCRHRRRGSRKIVAAAASVAFVERAAGHDGRGRGDGAKQAAQARARDLEGRGSDGDGRRLLLSAVSARLGRRRVSIHGGARDSQPGEQRPVVEVERGRDAQVDRGAARRHGGCAGRARRRAANSSGSRELLLMLLLLEQERGASVAIAAAAASVEGKVRDRGHRVAVNAVRRRGASSKGSVHGPAPPRKVSSSKNATDGSEGRKFPVERSDVVLRRPRCGLLQRLPVAAVVDDQGRGGRAVSRSAGGGLGAESQLRAKVERRRVGAADASAPASVVAPAAA